MQNHQTYKNRALDSLEGNWGKGALATLIVFLIEGIVGEGFAYPFNELTGAGISSIWYMLCLPLEWGFAVFFLNLIRREDTSYERLFDGYKDFERIFLAELLVGLAVFCGVLLLIVPGLILFTMFSMTEFVLKDNPGMSATDAMSESARLTKGHRMDILMLTLSFIGWAILSIMTLGIGCLFLAPYYLSTMAHYYEDLKLEASYQ
jgi:uncharacterized membrane protein